MSRARDAAPDALLLPPGLLEASSITSICSSAAGMLLHRPALFAPLHVVAYRGRVRRDLLLLLCSWNLMYLVAPGGEGECVAASCSMCVGDGDDARGCRVYIYIYITAVVNDLAWGGPVVVVSHAGKRSVPVPGGGHADRNADTALVAQAL